MTGCRLFVFTQWFTTTLVSVAICAVSATAAITLPESPLVAVHINPTDLALADSAFEWKDQIRSGAPSGRKSILQAIGMSILLPGSGSYYGGAKSQGRLLMGAEAGVWLSYFGLRKYADWKHDDYVRQSERFAGVNPSGKDDEYYRIITFYSSREQYNTFGLVSNPGAAYLGESDNWLWESESAQQQYRDLHNAERAANRNANYVLAMAGVNRVVSALISWQVVRRHNRSLDLASSNRPQQRSIAHSAPTVTGLSFATAPDSPGAALSFRLSF